MITLFTILTVLLALVIGTVIAVLIGGTGLLLVFGDLIVFGLIIWLIIRLIRRKS